MKEENFNLIEEQFKKEQLEKTEAKLKIIPKPKYQEDVEEFCKRNNINTKEKYIYNFAERIKDSSSKINMYYTYLAFEKALLNVASHFSERSYVKYFNELKNKNKENIIEILNNKDETEKLLNNYDYFVVNFEREGTEQLKRFLNINNEYYDDETILNKFEEMSREDIKESRIFSPLLKNNIDLVYESSDLIKELSDILKDNVKFHEMER